MAIIEEKLLTLVKLFWSLICLTLSCYHHPFLVESLTVVQRYNCGVMNLQLVLVWCGSSKVGMLNLFMLQEVALRDLPPSSTLKSLFPLRDYYLGQC